MLNSRFVLIITGPAGAGKSTVSRRLATELGHCVDIDIETINYMIVDGFDSKTLPNGEEVLDFTKWGLSGDVIGLLAKHLADSSYWVIIHGHVNDTLLEHIEKYININYKVLLLPSQQSAVERDRKRGSGMGKEMVSKHYEHFKKTILDGFTKIDSSNDNVADTVNRVKDIVIIKPWRSKASRIFQ